MDTTTEKRLKAHRAMTRSKKMPLESYHPALLRCLVKAGTAQVVLDAASKEEQSRLHEQVRRFRELKVRMTENNHPLAKQVAAVWVRLDIDGGRFGFGRIILENKDAGIEKLKISFRDSLTAIDDTETEGEAFLPFTEVMTTAKDEDLKHKDLNDMLSQMADQNTGAK